MEYQAGVHGKLIKKMLLVWIAAVKRTEVAEKLARQRFAVKRPAVEFENYAKGRLKMAIR